MIDKINQKDYNFEVDSDLKIDFLEEAQIMQPESTYTLMESTLTKMDNYEAEIGVPIYLFSAEMLKDFLADFRSSSIAVLENRFNVTKKYIEYAYDKRDGVKLSYKAININEISKLVNRVAYNNKFITRSQLFEIIPNMINYQDRIIPILLFEGIRGVKYKDIRLLKVEDIDFEKRIIHLENRDVSINDARSLDNLRFAINETEYLKEVIMHDGSLQERRYNLLYNSPYVIKKITYKNDNPLEPISDFRLMNRIKNIFELTGDVYLTGKSVYMSGLKERLESHFNKPLKNITHRSVEKYLQLYEEEIKTPTIKKMLRAIKD